MTDRRRAATFAAVIFATVLSQPAAAALALAIGVTNNPNHGIAIGTAYNYGTLDAARERAMRECRTFKSAPKANRFCRLIGALEKGGLAAAFDPKSDSTGMGWALAENRDGAERQAMDACRAAAPTGRQQFCKVDISRCDGD